jgi:hypothetical protein
LCPYGVSWARLLDRCSNCCRVADDPGRNAVRLENHGLVQPLGARPEAIPEDEMPKVAGAAAHHPARLFRAGDREQHVPVTQRSDSAIRSDRWEVSTPLRGDNRRDLVRCYGYHEGKIAAVSARQKCTP